MPTTDLISPKNKHKGNIKEQKRRRKERQLSAGPYKCPCGSSIILYDGSLTRHLKTKVHITYEYENL